MTNTVKKTIAKKPAVKAAAKATDPLAAFGFHADSDRMKVLRKLHASLGKPVPLTVLAKAADGNVNEAVQIIGLRAKREKLAFKIERDNDNGTVTLKRN